MATSSSSAPDALKDDRSAASTSGGDSGENNSTFPANSEKTELHSGEMKSIRATDDYNSILTAFDEYAAKGKSESVGFGFELGDMVWGKVKSHPWWPGQIYNEAFASPAVRRNKRDGHVLVAFFGDSSYGWFEPAELIPFEENFAEKSKQMVSRAFLNAVEEAVYEFERRRSLGLACRCRDQFNFWPCSQDNYFVVDVGDSEPGFYSMGQISKARNNFNPLEMVSFLEQLALAPMNDQQSSIEFIRNKASVLACRKALFHEFDDTYAQAFGTPPDSRPQRVAPVALDPSKATLNGRLLIEEALGKGNISVKPQTKNLVDKDKYLSKGRDGQINVKPKKAASSGLGDHAHLTAQSGVIVGEHQPMSNLASMATDIKTSGASKKHVEGGAKKAKVQKRLAGELNSDNTDNKKKRKKEIKHETTGDQVKPPVTVGNSVTMQTISEVPLHAPLGDNSRMEVDKDHTEGSPSSPVMVQQAVDIKNSELLTLLRDLRGLALNPFHGKERRRPDVIRRVFWKYRSLVYKKSLVLPSSRNEASETNHIRASVDTGIDKPIDKSKVKLMKPSVRPGDPTVGGRKRGFSDRSDDIKRVKMLDGSKGILKKKQLSDSDDIKKKKIGDLKKGLLAGEKKIIPHKSAESKVAAKNVAPSPVKRTVKLESSKSVEPSVKSHVPTMLIMKFPTNAALPSGAQLRAKFARFGPMDYSATRIFWKSYQCRLVYKYKFDAEAALKFALESSNNLFGNSNVRSYIKELEVEAAETTEPSRIPKEESLVEQRTPTKLSSQQTAQPKSILKKPSGDEGGGGRGNNTRVKFVLGAEESSSKILPSGGSSSNNFSVNATSTSNISSKNFLPNFNPQSSITTTSSTTLAPSSTSHFENYHPMKTISEKVETTHRGSYNVAHTQQTTKKIDISQDMLYLLKKCSDIVNNVRGTLGYVPYYPL